MWSFIRQVILAVLALIQNDQSDHSTPIMAGLVDVKQQTIDGKVTLDSGTIPEWLNGNFIRHGCGAFGNVGQQDPELPNFVAHLFDCIGMGTKFRLEKGHVTFTNRRYDTVSDDIYTSYGRDMNQSSVFFMTTFSKINPGQLNKHAKEMNDPTRIGNMPSVSWWKVGDQVLAMTEVPIGVVVDPNTVTQHGYIQYGDENLGYNKGVMFTNNPAHEHTDRDGTLWSVVSVVDLSSMPTMKIWRAVYKVGADKVRHVVGKFDFEDADLTLCSKTPPFSPYRKYESRFGYLHSFSFTEKYVILPETGYMHDPCFYAHVDAAKPIFPQSFTYEKDGFSRLLVMRKSDGIFLKEIKTKPFFATHQLGSYEEGHYIHMDMLTYDDAGIYTKYMYINSLINNDEVYATEVTRITIDTRDWTASFRNLRDGLDPEMFEMSNINYAYNGRKYTYAYMVKNFDKSKQNAITKLNVNLGTEVEYVFEEGLFAQEPQFVPRPGSESEDDGVLLVQGIDGNKNKAFLTIIDARTMSLISHVTAPGRALFGLHNRFFALREGQWSDEQ